MTPIKFRAKDYTGETRTGFAVINPDGTHFIIHYNSSRDLVWFRIDPATLSQYTGMKDMHGAEIYEGDIVTNGKHTGIVKWMPGKCCYQISPGGVFLSRQCEVQPRQ